MNAFLIVGLFIISMGNTQEAPESEEQLQFCTADVKECPDGSYVSRDPKNNCKFKDCGNALKPATCQEEKECDEGK